MKKTLLALTVAAFAASSANALTLVDNKETGTQVDFSGSLRLAWKSTATKDSERVKEHINHAVYNNHSRFGFRIQQDIAEGFYGLGRVEWRMRGTAPSQHNFDDIYTRQLYAGIGHKYLGELTYGHQTVITDEVKQTDLPNTLSLSDGLLNFAARKSIQYVYKGIEGLKLGTFYGGSSQRGNTARDLTQERKDTSGAAAIYRYKLNDLNRFVVGFGITKETFKATASRSGYDTQAYALGFAYTYDKTTVGVDLERKTTNDQSRVANESGLGNKRTQQEVRTVLYHRLTSDLNTYGMYAYKSNAVDYVASADKRVVSHQFMVGAEYWLARDLLAQYKLRAKTFLEWQTARNHNYTNGVKTPTTRDNTTVIGFRVFW